MKNSFLLVLATGILLAVSGIIAQETQPGSLGIQTSSAVEMISASTLSLTIYNRDLGQVRDVRRLSLTEGIQRLILSAISPKIDPSTIQVRALENPDMFQVQRLEYRDDLVDLDRIWEGMGGSRVQFVYDDSLISGILLRASKDHLILRVQDVSGAQIQIFPRDDIKRIDFDELPSDLVAEPTLIAWFNNRRADPDHPVELSYLTEGLSWEASYEAHLAGDPQLEDLELLLNGHFALKNDLPINFPIARIHLVAGDVHRSDDPRRIEIDALEEMEAPQQTPRGFFEYHRYPLDGQIDLGSHSTVLVPFLEDRRIQPKKLYVFEGQTRGTRVKTVIAFQNRKPTGPGIPLPMGMIRIFSVDEAGQLHFLGEDKLNAVPAGDEVRITVGDAFDLKGKRERVLHQRLARNRTKDRVQITLINSKNHEVVIAINERMYGVWEVISSQVDEQDISYQIEDSGRISFNVPVAAGKQAVLIYDVEYGY
ncbi:hypothetical protein AMJ86_02350 [bacterium SM23_57]|nr:MAG: hypothetical protein AMJ86_02350 [bacterium SM23_57]